MTFRKLILRSLIYHARSHLGALLGAAVGSAVLIGALVVGDSVRESLRAMALARLGPIEFALHSGDRFFRQDLAAAFSKTDPGRIQQSVRQVPSPAYRIERPAAAVLASGIVTRQDGVARANQAQVMGVPPLRWLELAGWDAMLLRKAGIQTNAMAQLGWALLEMPKAQTQAVAQAQDFAARWKLSSNQVQALRDLAGEFWDWKIGNSAFINETLAGQLGAKTGDEVIVRIRKPSALAQDAAISPRDVLSVAIRLKVGRIVSRDELGDFSLGSSQIPPANIFLPLDVLSQKLEIPGRANLLLETRFAAQPEPNVWGRKGAKLRRWLAGILRRGPSLSPSPVLPEPPVPVIEEFLRAELENSWILDDAQLVVGAIEQPQSATGGLYIPPFIELRTPRIFLEQPVIEAALRPRTRLLTGHRAVQSDSEGDLKASRIVTNAIPVLTYLANLIRAGDRSTPYSMVTAAGPPYTPVDLDDDQIVINEWLAEDLAVKPGDLIQLTYYLADSASKLLERTNAFRVHSIVRMTGHHADRTLMPEFPGLAKAESTHDWDAGFPLIHEIRAKDEAYWKQYRGTPKAFVTLTAGQRMWTNRFGMLTALRYPVPAGSFASVYQPVLFKTVLANLDPATVGLRYEPVRQQALAASSQAQDFGGLFIGFSLFLIVAALLLMALLFGFGIEQRGTEVGTLLALGFTPKRVRCFLLGEGVGVALAGGLIGAAGGTVYAKAMLYGLGTVWRDAVGTSSLRYYVEPVTLVIGGLSAVIVSAVTLWLGLRKQARQPARELLAQTDETATARLESKPANTRRGVWWGALGGMSATVLIGVIALTQQTLPPSAFFGAGALLLISGFGFISAFLAGLAYSEAAARLSLSGLGLRNTSRRRRRSMATIALLACGSFLIMAIGVFRLDPVARAHHRYSGTGGFALIGESTLPVLEDLNSEKGRDTYGLNDRDLAGAEFVPLRVKDGEEASCLNLNRAQKPRLLGVDPVLLDTRNAFTFARVLKGLGREHPWLLLNRQQDPEAVPAIGDAASIQWALGKKIGDTVPYTDENGRTFRIRLVGAVANSILQGNLLIAEHQFLRRFPGVSGYRMFLIDSPSNAVSNVSAALTRALRDLGMEVTPAPRRLAAFNAVQNTYLGTFQALGGLGLILGSAGLGVVVLRNVLERRAELAVLKAVGFRLRTVEWLVLSEHGALLGLGLMVGLAAGLISVLPALTAPGTEVPYRSLGITLGAVALNGLFWTWLATRWALRGHLLEALRNN